MLSIVLMVAGITAGLMLWGFILQRWQRGVVLLLAYLPFAGVVTLALYPSPLPILIKDFFFIIPAYLAFLWTRRGGVAEQRLPGSILIAMLALTALVFVQSFNPSLANWMVAAIGAKVWLFYLPLTWLAFVLLKSREDLVRVLRLLVAIAWIPCIVGIVQWIASMIFGYQATMTAFYGAAAAGVTQQFAIFNVGGDFFRIPSTFTFVTQYFGFTLAMIIPAYALMKMDTSGKWHRFSTATLWLVILASFMSGARAAYLFVPVLLVLIYSLEGQLKGAIKIALMLPLALLTTIYITGIDPIKMFNLMQELTENYSDDIAQQGLLDALASAPFGTGTGMNTGPARYAFDDPNAFIGIENYYAKAVVELGAMGLVVVVAIFAVLAIRGYKIHRRIKDAGLRSSSAALLAFIVTMALNSFKGWQIDLDPINVYFWVFAGFLLKLPYLENSVQVNAGNRRETAEERHKPSAGVA